MLSFKDLFVSSWQRQPCFRIKFHDSITIYSKQLLGTVYMSVWVWVFCNGLAWCISCCLTPSNICCPTASSMAVTLLSINKQRLLLGPWLLIFSLHSSAKLIQHRAQSQHIPQWWPNSHSRYKYTNESYGAAKRNKMSLAYYKNIRKAHLHECQSEMCACVCCIISFFFA